MKSFEELEISRAITDAYHTKFSKALSSDVVIVGAGPSGMIAAWKLCEAGFRTVILEKRLSIGGGIWGGAMGMNEVVVQQEALPILEEAGVRYQPYESVYTADAIELACALSLKALQAGAVILNLMYAEDICVHGDRVTGVVANRTLVGEKLPIDPIVLSSHAVIDATGHEACMVNSLRRRELITKTDLQYPCEGPMDAPAGEQFVVEYVTEVFPGLWTTGMSVCASFGGPRMGPIFGGMLMSGKKVAQQIQASLRQ